MEHVQYELVSGRMDEAIARAARDHAPARVMVSRPGLLDRLRRLLGAR